MPDTFNRTYAVPSGSTWPKFPTGLDSWGQSGKPQLRTTTQIGRTWEETFPPMKANSANTRAFIAYINQLWQNRTIFEIDHQHLGSTLGTITGGGVINGANQTGSSIIVTALTGTDGTSALRHGDIIKFSNLNHIFDVTADVAVGATSIPINPIIISGQSPTNSQAITYNNVKFRATLVEDITLPKASYDTWYLGISLKFRECP